jgi:phage terminase large subunit-like protein
MPSKRSEPSAPSSKAHRVDQYAAGVVAGLIVAGPLVRLACERHERDRDREGQPEWAYRFDVARADHAIAFFETVLRLPDVVDDDGEPVPFLLQPFQAFIVGSLFGWVDASGQRRFREGYIEIGKGNGKTPMCAGIGLYGLVMDGERAAEVYAAAADQDQAQILFRDAVRIAQASPDLWAILKPSGGDHIWQLEHKPSLSFFKMFSRESGAKSGTRPHIALLDELHEHGTPQISIKIRAGAKRRKQPMFVEITNSGFDRASICWEHHEHARKVVEQIVDDEQWFAYVCALDEGDDPLVDETCWPKANPNLGVSIGLDYLRRQVANAKNIQAETNTVLRLNFCIWTQANFRAINMGLWRACQTPPPDSELLGEPCFGGLDLGQSDDFSAWARIWALEDVVVVKMRFWLPQAAKEKYPHRPYAQWERAGILTITEGNTTDYDRIETTVLEDCRTDGVREVAYDKRFAEQLAQHLLGAGVQMIDQPQGFQLNEAIKRKGELIAAGTLCHGNDEILAWMASNYVLRTGRVGDVRPDKDKAADKIDGQVALDMALSRWVRMPMAPASVYLTRGVLDLGDYLT